MKRSIAELITRDPEKFAHHDRVFKNNPVVMQGMGHGSAGGACHHGQKCFDAGRGCGPAAHAFPDAGLPGQPPVPLRDEQPAPEELEKKLLPRALVYSGSAAVVYLAAYPILTPCSAPTC